MTVRDMYVTIEYDGKAYVKMKKDVNKNEHVSGVYSDIKTACNVARKIARQCGLVYIPRNKVNDKNTI